MDVVQPVHLDEILNASHENKWVAIAPNHRSVVAAAEDLRQLMQQTAGQDVIFHRVLPRDVSFAPVVPR